MKLAQPASCAARHRRGRIYSQRLAQRGWSLLVCRLLFSSIGLVFTAGVMAQTIAQAKPAPDFALRAISGENLRLSEFRGQVVAVGFWARWCGDCRQAMKALNAIYQKYQPAGLTILGIDVDDSQEQTAAMARSLGLSFPVLMDDRKAASSLFNVKSMPLIVVIDREGNQRYSHSSFELGDEARIGDELRTLLNE